jgi:DNA-binding HxlR family transcriptional regulator
MPKLYGQRCPVAKTLEVVGDRWTLLVVRDLLGGARRFHDLQAGLPGLAPNILSERLKLMEAHALVSRRFYSDHPPRAEYELTAKGKELGVVVGALAAWGARHVYKGARLVHADSGKDVRLGYFRADTGERVPGSAVRVRRGSKGTPARRG